MVTYVMPAYGEEEMLTEEEIDIVSSVQNGIKF